MSNYVLDSSYKGKYYVRCIDEEIKNEINNFSKDLGFPEFSFELSNKNLLSFEKIDILETLKISKNGYNGKDFLNTIKLEDIPYGNSLCFLSKNSLKYLTTPIEKEKLPDLISHTACIYFKNKNTSFDVVNLSHFFLNISSPMGMIKDGKMVYFFNVLL